MTFLPFFFCPTFGTFTRANCMSFHFMWKTQVDTRRISNFIYSWHKRLKGHKNTLAHMFEMRRNFPAFFTQTFSLKKKKLSSAQKVATEERRVYLAQVKIKTILIAHVSSHVFLLDPSSSFLWLFLIVSLSFS